MKPFELYTYIISLTKEKFDKKKLSFYLMRAKIAIENLTSYGWKSEDIKAHIVNLNARGNKGEIPNNYRYIIGILCNTKVSPTVKSVDTDDIGDYSEWVKQELIRVKNKKMENL